MVCRGVGWRSGVVAVVLGVALAVVAPAGGVDAAPSVSSRPLAGDVTDSARSGESPPEVGAISGSVISGVDGAPVAGVCVSAVGDENAPAFGVTDESGGYVLGGLASGQYSVRFDRCAASADGDDSGLIVPPSREVTVEAPGVVDGVDARLVDEMDEPSARSAGSPTASSSGEDLPEVGAISGSVISGEGGAPVAGVCVSAVSDENAPEFGQTDESGGYMLGGLESGEYSVRFDRCAASADGDDSGLIVPPSREVTVEAPGVVDGVDARSVEEPAQPAVPSAGFTSESQDGHITGTVTSDAGGGPLEGICVFAYDPDTDAEGYFFTGPDGIYDIGGLATGSYEVRFIDCWGGDYAAEYFDDTYSYGSVALVAVTAPQTTSGIDAGLADGGHITGTVTADAGGAPLEDICVSADDPTIDVEGGGYTGPDGTYDIVGLPAGLYRVRFSDCSGGGYLSEYFDDTRSAGSAVLVAVSSGQTTSGIDAGLASGGRIAGTVTDAASGQPVPYAGVAVLRTSDFSLAGAAVADPGGDFWVQVPTGTYYLYLLDGTGRHADGFFGPPTTVTVTAGSFTDANPTMAPTRGTITGTVTDTGTATSLAGVRAITINTATGALERAALSGAGGNYTIGDVPVGSYWVVFLDPTGNHAARYGLSAPTVATASTASVTAGATAPLHAALPAQSPPPAGSSITGTVTETGTNAALSGVVVVALRTSDYGLARTTTTNANGTYTLDVAPGTYHLAFLDPTGTHTSEWSGNQPISNLAGAATVAAPSTGADASLASTTGGFTGTVTAQANGAAIPDAWVIAINTNGQITRSTVTAANGSYTLAGLAPGNYRAVVVDPTGTHPVRYYPASVDYAGATAIAVTPANTASGINLALPSN